MCRNICALERQFSHEAKLGEVEGSNEGAIRAAEIRRSFGQRQKKLERAIFEALSIGSVTAGGVIPMRLHPRYSIRASRVLNVQLWVHDDQVEPDACSPENIANRSRLIPGFANVRQFLLISTTPLLYMSTTSAHHCYRFSQELTKKSTYISRPFSMKLGTNVHMAWSLAPVPSLQPQCNQSSSAESQCCIARAFFAGQVQPFCRCSPCLERAEHIMPDEIPHSLPFATNTCGTELRRPAQLYHGCSNVICH